MKILYIFCIFVLCLTAELPAQIHGCRDPEAVNYNPLATKNDGSCLYNSATVIPSTSIELPSVLAESSGLIYWNHNLLTHNDDTDPNLYIIDTSTATISKTYTLSGVINKEWEEISQDDFYIYIGDFGNNSTGNRTDLHVLRIDKNSLLSGSPDIDTIFFSYSDQTSFTNPGADKTDFDCEAFIVTKDSIYLFTKQWVSGKTSVYSLPKSPGKYTAQLQITVNVEGLITGATYLESKNLIVLCGYSTLLQPFLYLLYDFTDNDFSKGNKRKISLSLAFHQIEGIATLDGLKYYVTNEYFSRPPFVTSPQKLHSLDLSPYLQKYLDTQATCIEENFPKSNGVLYPNPTNDEVNITTAASLLPARYTIRNQLGQIIDSGVLRFEQSRISTRELTTGIYFLTIGVHQEYALTVMNN
ncbi:MAG: T9SS type A sorting domain-containing protein [Ignavibacteria bacterium]|nr:T9SS type A sorting domain-containing protein [Ignavibacteria bacterium]